MTVQHRAIGTERNGLDATSRDGASAVEEENYEFAIAQRAVGHATLCITTGTSGGVPVASRLAGIAE